MVYRRYIPRNVHDASDDGVSHTAESSDCDAAAAAVATPVRECIIIFRRNKPVLHVAYKRVVRIGHAGDDEHRVCRAQRQQSSYRSNRGDGATGFRPLRKKKFYGYSLF